MKSLVLSFLALVLGFSTSFAQQVPVPQGTFENWAPRRGTEAPQGWQTTDDIIFALLGFPMSSGTVTKSTDRNGGSFAAKLETKNAALLGTVPGFMVVGTSLNLSSDFPGGVPFTSRPANLQFHYKLTGANAVNDSASVAVFLTRTVNGQAELVAGAEMVFGQLATTYTLASMPLTYQSNLTPDSLRIIFSSGAAENLTVGTALFIDDVVMTGTITSGREALVAEKVLAVYPNPSTGGKFTLEARQTPALLNAALTVSDATGRTVLTQPAVATTLNGSRTIDLSTQPAGVYTLRMAAAEGTVVRRLMVR